MRELITRLLMVFVFLTFISTSASAAANGTRVEAKALVDRAAAYIKIHGKQKALAEFNKPRGKFVYKDLYMFAYDFNGVNLALGSNPSMTGKNLLQLQDADGNYFVKDLIVIARKGGGWYEYKWSHPGTKKIKKKVSYVLKIDDSMFIGCGAYK